MTFAKISLQIHHLYFPQVHIAHSLWVQAHCTGTIQTHHFGAQHPRQAGAWEQPIYFHEVQAWANKPSGVPAGAAQV